MTRISHAVVLAAIALALFTFGCTEPPTDEPVVIATFSKALSYTPLYVAKHNELFKEHDFFRGRGVVYREYNDRPAISAALAAGEIDLFFSAEIPAIMSEAQGDDLQIWALSSTASQRILVRTDAGINEPRELLGRRIAVLQGTSSHYGLLKLLRDASMTEKDVTIVYMPPGEARAAFETDQIDAWAVWAPFGEEQEVSGAGAEIEGQGAWIHSVMSIPTAVAENQPELAQAAAEVIQISKAWIVRNPSQAQEIAAKEMGLSPAVVQQAWQKFTWDGEITATTISDLQDKARFLAEQSKTRDDEVVDVTADLLAPHLQR